VYKDNNISRQYVHEITDLVEISALPGFINPGYISDYAHCTASLVRKADCFPKAGQGGIKYQTSPIVQFGTHIVESKFSQENYSGLISRLCLCAADHVHDQSFLCMWADCWGLLNCVQDAKAHFTRLIFQHFL